MKVPGVHLAHAAPPPRPPSTVELITDVSSACERAAKRLPKAARDSVCRMRMLNSPPLGNFSRLGPQSQAQVAPCVRSSPASTEIPWFRSTNQGKSSLLEAALASAIQER